MFGENPEEDGGKRSYVRKIRKREENEEEEEDDGSVSTARIDGDWSMEDKAQEPEQKVTYSEYDEEFVQTLTDDEDITMQV
jgi:hypothetical protein